MHRRIGNMFIVPLVAIIGVAAGSVGGAYAFDHFASQYLWPEPEDLTVYHAPSTPADHDAPDRDSASTY